MPPAQPFNPHQNPRLNLSANLSLTPARNSFSENPTDSDGDGLSDEQEGLLGSDAYNPDTDGDGLGDGVEFTQLGTSVVFTDTDDDNILDLIEVNGYQDAGGVWWYLDPLTPDSNGDGVMDTLECPALVNPASGTACPDTDGDGAPDFNDHDNDDDGVPDRDDLAANVAMGSGRDTNGLIQGFADQTFALSVSQMNPGVPHQVTFQFRPTNPSHLWYNMSVLDWPSNDYYGNVQRHGDTTFQDVQPQAQSTDANGDLRLVPMLEIEIPYQAGNYGGLPTLANPAPITVTNPITSWLDIRQAQEYGLGVSYKSADSANLLVYIPVTLDKNDDTGDPTAFVAQMPYWPTQEAFSQPHQVRLIWIVQAITNQCIAFALTDGQVTGCQTWSPDAVTNIHTYVDDWYLTGLTVREDRGVDISIIHEEQPSAQPGYDAASYYERGLWSLFSGLESSFLAGRVDGGQTFGLGEISRRFDVTRTATLTESWGITTTFNVHTFSLEQELHLAYVPMTYTQQVLNANFGTAAANTQVTLLYASEQRERTATLTAGPTVITAPAAENGVIDSPSLAIALDPDAVPSRTVVNLRWAPFRALGADEWAAQPPADYLEYVRGRIAHNPAEYDFIENISVVTGDDYVTANGFDVLESFYVARYLGMNGLVELNELPTPAPNAAADALISNNLAPDLGDTFGSVAAAIKDMADLFADAKEQSTSILSLNKGFDAAGVGFASAGAVFGVLALVAGDGPIGQALTIAKDLMTLLDFGRTILQAIKNGQTWGETVVVGGATAVIVLIVVVVIIIVTFVIQIWTSDVEVGSVAFNQALVKVIATTIVIAIYILASMNPIGAIIVTIIGAIDGLLSLICNAVEFLGDTEITDEGSGWTYWVCGGITGALVELIAYLFYDSAPLLDMSRTNRLQYTPPQPILVDPNLGYSGANQIQAGLVVTSSLYPNADADLNLTGTADEFIDDENLIRTTLRYTLTLSEELGDDRFHVRAGIETDQMIDEWLPTGAVTPTHYVTDSLSIHIPLSLIVGINQPLPLYLAEGQGINTVECVPVTFGLGCWLNGESDTLYINLGERYPFDIFPATLAEFVSLARLDGYANGYAPLWSQTGSPTWPVQADADGDGLRSPDHPTLPGNDPNDSTADADNDGLSDFFEIKYNSNPLDPDSDQDGLSDADEVFYDTNPNLADSDQDGLSDGAEITGWAFIYYYDASTGTTHTTWVVSDPLTYDTDGDELSDQQEKLYGFNPRVYSAEAVLSISTALDDSDGFVAPGQVISYTAVISNETTSRQANGLLTVEFPPAVQDSTLDPKPFILEAGASTTINGTVMVDPLAPSQQITLTNRAGAVLIPQISEQSLWLQFNEEVNTGSYYDEARPQHSITCTTCPAPTTGYQANALTFNGVDDFLTVGQPDHLGLSGPSFTFMAWVRFPSTVPLSPLFVAGQQSGSTWSDYLEFRVAHGLPELAGEVGGNPIHVNPAPTPVPVNVWYHLAWRYDGLSQQLTLFRDGVALTSETVTALPATITSAFIGQGLVGYFDGQIDNLEIYPTALTDAAIAALVLKPAVHLNFENSSATTDLYGNLVAARNATTNSTEPYAQTGGIGGGNAAAFDGQHNVVLPTTPSTRYSAYTHSFWVFPQNTTGLQGIAGSGMATDINDLNAAGFGLDATASIFIENGTRLVVGFGDGTQFRTATSGNILTPNQWNHIVLSYGEDGVAQYHVYVNGIFRETLVGTFAAASQNPRMPGFIGSATQHGIVTYHGMYVYYDLVDGDGDMELYFLFNGNRVNRQDFIAEGDQWFPANGVNPVENSNPVQFYQYQGLLTGYEDDGEDWDDPLDPATDDRLNYDFWALDPSQYLFNIAQPSQNNATIYTNQNINNLLAEFIFGDPVLFDLDNDDPGVANLVASHDNPSQPFTGYLDEFREYHRALTASEAQLLYRQSQPNSVAFNLDEPPGVSTFADFAGSYLQGACNFLGDTCPITGIPGLSNQMALFGSLPAGDSNANDYITLPSAAAPFTDGSFTLSAWANPRELAGATRPLIGTDDDRSVALTLVNGFPTFTFDNGTPYGHTLTAPAPLNENEWVHLAAVYHAGSPAGDSHNWATTADGASVSLIDGSGAANVLDTQVSTGATTVSTANAWIRIDLGQVRQINQITVRSLGDNSPPDGTVRLFYDNNFAGVSVWQMNTSFSSYQSFPVNERFGRYVEIKLDGSATDPLTVYKIEVFGASDQPRRELYVDGTLVASLAGPAPVRTYNNIFIGRGRSSGSYDYYRGYLDQVQFYDYGVKNITNLLRDVPVFRLRLDEQSQPTTNQFSNSVAGLPHAANSPVSCVTTEWCPVAGPPGKMNRSAVFTASRLDTTLAQTVGGEFTISFWIKGAQGGYPSGDAVHLRTTATSYAQVGFDSQGLPTFTVNNGNALTYLSPFPLEPNQWYHVVFRRSAANGERSIFVNGQKIATGSAGTRPSGNLTALVGAFSGNELVAQLDELNIHNLALTDGQISRLYDYQASWYEIAYDNRIVVDGETPNLYLTADLPAYLRRQDVPLFLAITADDLGPTGDSPFASGVISLTYQVNGGAWQTAVPDGALWLLTVTPATAGPLNLTVRATDQSDNSHTTSRTLTVDGTPPAAAFAQPYSSNIITTQTNGNQVTVWLQGTASDSGSGLANITLSLSDNLGRDVSGAQAAQVTGSNWGVAYPLLDSLSTGTYTATLIARDFVGNTITQTTRIRVDDSLAQAWLANVDAGQTYQPDEYLRQITYTAGTAITLTGTVLDTPYPSNSDLYLAFEEPTFDGWVMDASRSHNWLACTTCPAPVAGAKGQGVAFTAGTTLSAPQTPVTLTQFTLAFWLNTVGAAASQQTLLDYGPDLQVERLAGSHQLAFTTGSQTLTLTNTTTLADNTWNHVAFVYDGDNQLIYVNGQLLAFAPLSEPVTLGDTFTVGGNFTGQMDELLLYRQAWPSTLISQLQTPIGYEVQQIEMALVRREFNAPPPTTFDWQPTTLNSQPGDPFAAWSYTFPTYPLPGYYQLYLRTTDGSGRELILPRVWEGAFDCAGRIRYVNPDATGTGTGLSWDDGFTTLQDALAIPLCPHAEIWVKAGTYYPDEGAGQTANDRNATFHLHDMITVYGGFNGTETARDQRDWQNNTTILSGDLDQNDGTGSPVGNNAFNVVTGSGVNTTAGLDGFTISGGLANQPGTFNKQNGAGILNNGAILTLQNLLITHNEAPGSPGNGQPGNGGGLYNINSSSVISNVVISHNQSSRYGGGIYNEGSDLILFAVTFSNNTAVWDGGGLYNQEGAPVLQNVLFSQNQGRSGAGMFTLNGDASLSNVTFQGNNASSRGGGLTNALGSDSLLLNVLFTGNEADFFGGAMFNDGSNPTLTQVTISGNWATTCTTPTFCGGGLFNLNSSPQIRNSLIANNRERSNTGTATANLYNYTLNGGSSLPVIQSSLVQGSGGSGAGWNGSLGTDGGRNLDGDPAFFAPVDPATAPTPGGDFRLLGTSVAIDAGNNALCPLADGRGEARTDWGCDLGMYEMQFTDLTTVTRPLQTGQTVTFGPTLGRVSVNDDGGCLTGLSLQRVDANHPQALSVAMQTGRYWVLTPLVVTMVLPLN